MPNVRVRATRSGAALVKNIDAAVELLQTTMRDAVAAAAVDGGTGTVIPISIKVRIAVL